MGTEVPLALAPARDCARRAHSRSKAPSGPHSLFTPVGTRLAAPRRDAARACLRARERQRASAFASERAPAPASVHPRTNVLAVDLLGFARIRPPQFVTGALHHDQ